MTEKKDVKTSPTDPTALSERDRVYKEVYAVTKDHKAATRAFCAGNKWMIENAKGTGNW